MAHPDGCRDELAPEAAIPVQRQGDDCRLEMSAWDALAGVPRDAWEDVARLQVALPDADAGKWAVRVRGVPARDAQQSEIPAARARPDAAAELCTLAADRSAARSCAAREDQVSVGQPDAAERAMWMPKL
jgi:hypothetical protein